MREFLKGLDLETNVINSIMAKYGELLNEEKAKTSDYKEQVSKLEKEIEDANGTIKELKEKAPDVEAIKKEAFENGKAESTKALEDFKKDIALDKALAGSKAKDVALLKKMIDSEKLTYEEEENGYKITGLDEQITGAKESHGYLFETEETSPQRISVGGDHKEEANTNSDARRIMGLE